MKKYIIYLMLFLLNVIIVNAQTGLFSSGGASDFAKFGIVVVVIFFALREVIKNIKNFRKK